MKRIDGPNIIYRRIRIGQPSMTFARIMVCLIALGVVSTGILGAIEKYSPSSKTGAYRTATVSRGPLTVLVTANARLKSHSLVAAFCLSR